MEKHRKSFLNIVLCALLAVCICMTLAFVDGAHGAHAEEIVSEGSEITQEDEPTFFGRIWEWTTEHATEILTVVGDIILVAYLVAKNIMSKKRLVDLGKNLLTVKDGVTNTETSQRSVVNVTNELIEGYNRFEKALNNFDTTENERYKTMLAAFAQTKAILEILMTVYANSKNIPQGVKDLVNLKYAEVLKLVGDEDKLKEIAETDEAGKSEDVSEDSAEE